MRVRPLSVDTNLVLTYRADYDTYASFDSVSQTVPKLHPKWTRGD